MNSMKWMYWEGLMLAATLKKYKTLSVLSNVFYMDFDKLRFRYDLWKILCICLLTKYRISEALFC